MNEKMIASEFEEWLITSKKETPLGDLVYKSKQLSGLDIFDKDKASSLISKMTDYHHKILNIFLQRVHNAMYDKKGMYKRVDDKFTDEVYFKVDYTHLLDKMGTNKNGEIYSDVRYLEKQILSLSGIFIKIRDNDLIESFPLFSNVVINKKKEDVYFAFNKEILKAIASDYRRFDCEDGSSPSYITLNMSEIHNKSLSQGAIMLYEFLLSNKLNVTVNIGRFELEEVFSYISNITYTRPSQLIKLLDEVIKELEEALQLRVFYFCQTFARRDKIKNISFKAFYTWEHNDYDNSKATGRDFMLIDEIDNPNLFKVTIKEYRHLWERKLTNFNYKQISLDYFGEDIDWGNSIEDRNLELRKILESKIIKENKFEVIDKFFANDSYSKYVKAMEKVELPYVDEDKFKDGYRF